MADYSAPFDSGRSASHESGQATSPNKKKRSKSRFSEGLSAAGKTMSDYGQQTQSDVERSAEDRMQSYKRGGVTKKRGAARLHRGEKITKRKRGKKNGRQ
jgi:hypothetical protein